MRKTVLMLVAVTAVVVPAAGWAKHPVTDSSGSGSGKTPTVMFVVHGTVTSFSAPSGSSSGSVSVTFTSANRDSDALKAASQPLAFLVGSTTKISGGKAVVAGDQVLVKVRAAKNATPATLAGTAAFQVVDQGMGG